MPNAPTWLSDAVTFQPNNEFTGGLYKFREERKDSNSDELPTPIRASNRIGNRKYTQEQCIMVVRRFKAANPGKRMTEDRYDLWRKNQPDMAKLPSSGALRTAFCGKLSSIEI